MNVHTTLARLRNLRGHMSPVTDAELPGLTPHILRIAPLITAGFIAVSVGSRIMGVLTGSSGLERAIPVAALFTVVPLVLLRLMRTPWGREHAELLLCVQALQMHVQILAARLHTFHHDSPFAPYTFVVVIGMAAIVPWRPTTSLIVGAAGVAVVVIDAALHGPTLPDARISLWVSIFLSAALTLIAMLSCQVTRRMWADLTKARHHLVASERMSQLGHLSAGIAHELKTPIAASLNALETARGLAAELAESIGHEEVTEADLRAITGEIDASIAAARRGAERSAEFVKAVREHTKGLHETDRVAFRVVDRVEGVLMLMHHRIKQSAVTVDASGVARDLHLEGDPTKLEQVVTNLVSNALDACEESGVGRSIRVTARPLGKGVLIAVEDDGPGVPEAIRGRIFETFFTTRGSGAGTGLGLSLSRDLVEGAFHGHLELRPREDGGRGARFEITLPRSGAFARGDAPFRPACAIAPSPRAPGPGEAPAARLTPAART